MYSPVRNGWGLQRALGGSRRFTGQFAKLATIRNDIAGLIEKLSDAVSASSN
jgi:hypothetical protein